MSSGTVYKHLSQDKDDGYIPAKDNFLHDDWRVSNQRENFHIANGYGYRMRGRGWSFGVKKKIWCASPRGERVDGYNNCGKSDE